MNNIDKYSNFLGNQSSNPYSTAQMNEAVNFPKEFKTNPSVIVVLNADKQLESFEYYLEERTKDNLPTIRYDFKKSPRYPTGDQNINLSSCNLDSSVDIKNLNNKLNAILKVQMHALETLDQIEKALKVGSDLKAVIKIKDLRVI